MTTPIEEAALALYEADRKLAEAKRDFWRSVYPGGSYVLSEAAGRVAQAERAVLAAVRAARPRC